MHFCGPLRTVLGVYPNAFDANRGTAEGPSVHVTGTSRGDRLETDVQK
jgi:hypothetical protein